MPLNKLDNFIKNTEGRILYVSPSDLDSTDSISNQGNSLAQPFKTLQRALIESARFSYLKGNSNDEVEKTTILLMPGEHIVDNFKREAMKNLFLRGLLLSDSIYISSNLTFNDLSPLSSYLGKPGNKNLGGMDLELYIHRQRQHREAEISAVLDTNKFIEKSTKIYGYNNFVCDTSGSICEVVNPQDPSDPLLTHLADNTLILLIKVASFLKFKKILFEFILITFFCVSKFLDQFNLLLILNISPRISTVFLLSSLLKIKFKSLMV